jgi:hypothetical protein
MLFWKNSITWDQANSLTNVLLALRQPLPASVAAAGDDEFVDRIPRRIRDDDWDTTSMEQHRPDGLAYEEVENDT